jgi:putative ABC transport system permease protein
LSVLLLIGAGLFVRSLRHVRRLDVGADLDRVLLVHMDLDRAGFDSIHARGIWSGAYERVRRIPGVESAALVEGSIPKQAGSGMAVRLLGRDSLPPLTGGGPYYSTISADYFPTLGTRLIRGRGITEADIAARARVAVINQELADHYWPAANPVGQCMLLGNDETCTEVVGVVEHVLMLQMIGDVKGQLYLPSTHPFTTGRWRRSRALLIRSGGDTRAVAALVRREVQALAAGMPYVTAQSLEELVAPELRPWRLGAAMFGVFGALALAIAAVGLYGVVAYSVSQRTQEIGVRMALGARREDVIRLVVIGGMRVVAGGLVLGVLIALGAGRWLKPLLYDTSPHDLATFAAATATLAAAALLASLIPAWRASRVDPVVALRAD